MIYFLCFLLFVSVVGGKPKDAIGVVVLVGLVTLDLALLFSVLLVGGYIKL